MSSREKILTAVKNNQPAQLQLPATQLDAIKFSQPLEQFCTVLQNIGGTVERITSLEDISAYIKMHFQEGHNLVTTIEGVAGLELLDKRTDPHELEVVEFALLPAVFGVAENGAVWLSEKEMGTRVLPFITQHLAVVLDARQLVSNMHEAYDRIGQQQYGFGAFIAGPSKTADIEQSLVIGAHGARTMTVFVVESV